MDCFARSFPPCFFLFRSLLCRRVRARMRMVWVSLFLLSILDAPQTLYGPGDFHSLIPYRYLWGVCCATCCVTVAACGHLPLRRDSIVPKDQRQDGLCRAMFTLTSTSWSNLPALSTFCGDTFLHPSRGLRHAPAGRGLLQRCICI